MTGCLFCCRGASFYKITMIALTKINGSKFVLNADVIRYIETTPDTMISLLNGDKIIVTESMDKVVALAIEYNRRVRIFSQDLE